MGNDSIVQNPLRSNPANSEIILSQSCALHGTVLAKRTETALRRPLACPLVACTRSNEIISTTINEQGATPEESLSCLSAFDFDPVFKRSLETAMEILIGA